MEFRLMIQNKQKVVGKFNLKEYRNFFHQSLIITKKEFLTTRKCGSTWSFYYQNMDFASPKYGLWFTKLWFWYTKKWMWTVCFPKYYVFICQLINCQFITKMFNKICTSYHQNMDFFTLNTYYVQQKVIFSAYQNVIFLHLINILLTQNFYKIKLKTVQWNLRSFFKNIYTYNYCLCKWDVIFFAHQNV